MVLAGRGGQLILGGQWQAEGQAEDHGEQESRQAEPVVTSEVNAYETERERMNVFSEVTLKKANFGSKAGRTVWHFVARKKGNENGPTPIMAANQPLPLPLSPVVDLDSAWPEIST